MTADADNVSDEHSIDASGGTVCLFHSAEYGSVRVWLSV